MPRKFLIWRFIKFNWTVQCDLLGTVLLLADRLWKIIFFQNKSNVFWIIRDLLNICFTSRVNLVVQISGSIVIFLTIHSTSHFEKTPWVAYYWFVFKLIGVIEFRNYSVCAVYLLVFKISRVFYSLNGEWWTFLCFQNPHICWQH